jgi:predicted Holliday junction resolvase-like endonuclease
VEIKTGASRLSKTQSNLKKLVKEGKVFFETFRVNQDGCTIKRAEYIERT